MGLDPADPESIVRGVLLTDPPTAAAGLQAFRSAGADLPVVYPLLPPGPPDPEAAVETLRPFAP
jgi:hypothetical protein